MKKPRYDDLALLTILTSLALFLVLFLNSLEALPYLSLSGVRDPLKREYSYLAFFFGTLYVSLLALLLASLVGLGSAVYLVRYAPERARRYYSMLVEAMASIPSVVYGLRGLLFLGSFLGYANKLVASLTLGMMLLPTIISLSRSALESVPRDLIEAAYALGAMEHEAAKIAISYSKPRIISSILIARMRAIGETMAVTMTVGNVSRISLNPLDPGSTLTSLIATEFGGTIDPISRSAIVFAALILLALSTLIYSLSRRVIRHEERSRS